MQVESFMLCDAAVMTGGKLNVLGAFDAIYTPKVPTAHSMCLALRLRFDRAEEGNHTIKLSVNDADGKALGHVPDKTCEVKIPDGESFAVVNQIVQMVGMPLKAYGDYSIELSINNRHEASLPLKIKPMPGQVGTPGVDEEPV